MQTQPTALGTSGKLIKVGVSTLVSICHIILAAQKLDRNQPNHHQQTDLLASSPGIKANARFGVDGSSALCASLREV